MLRLLCGELVYVSVDCDEKYNYRKQRHHTNNSRPEERDAVTHGLLVQRLHN